MGSSKENPHTDIADLNRFNLARLQRFARIVASNNSEILQFRRLARRAAFSSYRDCVASGLENEARDIIGRTFGQRALRGGTEPGTPPSTR